MTGAEATKLFSNNHSPLFLLETPTFSRATHVKTTYSMATHIETTFPSHLCSEEWGQSKFRTMGCERKPFLQFLGIEQKLNLLNRKQNLLVSYDSYYYLYFWHSEGKFYLSMTPRAYIHTIISPTSLCSKTFLYLPGSL